MKTHLLIFAFTLITNVISSQNLKTYNSDFEDGEYPNGKAVYTYYEDEKTYEYIKHGSFKYTKYFKNDQGTYNAVFSGSFKHNKKNGLWTYTIQEYDCLHTDGSYYTGTTKLTANYIDGVPNGNWNYSCTSKWRDKNYYGTWGEFNTIPNESTVATFKNGHFVGKLTSTMGRYQVAYPNISGQYDENGFPTGKWVFKDYDEERVKEFKNGFLIKDIVRNLTTGEVIYNETDSAKQVEITEKIISGQYSSSDLDSLGIVIDTSDFVGKSAGGLLWFGESFNNDKFKYRYIGGDLTYTFKDGLSLDSRNYGKVLKMKILKTKKKTYLDLATSSDYQKEKHNIRNGNYLIAKTNLEIFMSQNSTKLSENSKSIIKKDIAFCDEQIILFQNANSLLLNSEAELAKISNYESIDFIDQANTAIFIYDSLLINYSQCFSSEIINKIKSNKIICVDYVKKSEELIELQNKIKVEIDKSRAKTDKLIVLFQIDCDEIGNINSIGKKEKLYDDYSMIFQYLEEKIDEDMPKKLQILIEINALQDKIIEILLSDDKTIEKELKKVKTIEEKIKILSY